MKPKSAPAALSDPLCACATARQVARLLTQVYDAKLRKAGIEAPQFALLMALEKAGPSSQVDLGRRFALDKTTVSRNLTLLERNGWVRPEVGKDRRERIFSLTAEGRERLQRAMPEWKKAQEALRAGMSGKEWDEMFRAFRTVASVAQGLQPE